MWEQILVNGLVSGGKYALLALGFSLIFGVARIMNLTHTAYYMLSAYLIYYLTVSLGIPLPLAWLLGIAVMVALGLAVYRRAKERGLGEEKDFLK